MQSVLNVPPCIAIKDACVNLDAVILSTNAQSIAPVAYKALMPSGAENALIFMNDDMIKIDSNFSIESRITLDWSNRNVNSITEYSSIRENEETHMDKWCASASSSIPSNMFVLHENELSLVSVDVDSLPHSISTSVSIAHASAIISSSAAITSSLSLKALAHLSSH